MNPFFPYTLGEEIDKHFQSQGNKPLTDEEFYIVSEAINQISPAKNQIKMVDVYKTLDLKEVLSRANKIVKLSNSLKTIAKNRAV